MEANKVLIGDSLEVLKTIPDESIDCCVTSPPYYGLRDYGTGKWVGGDPKCPHRRMTKYSPNTITGHAQTELIGNVGDAIYKKVCPLCGAVREDHQIGLEETPEEYIQKLVAVFHEVRRCLKVGGTLWVNIGDSYAGASSNCKTKDLIGIPWMLAFALRADGWYLRQDIIWRKPNPMPESVKDRCTKSHEYIFLLSKSPTYYFDAEAIAEPISTSSVKRYLQDIENQEGSFTPSKGNGKMKASLPRFGGAKYGDNDDPHMQTYSGNTYNPTAKRNKRDVWEVSTQAVKEAHFATFPEKLVEPMILAGCPEGGIVLDPFMGSGTTGRVAVKLSRNYLGVELNPEYVDISNRRLDNVQITLAGI